MVASINRLSSCSNSADMILILTAGRGVLVIGAQLLFLNYRDVNELQELILNIEKWIWIVRTECENIYRVEFSKLINSISK